MDFVVFVVVFVVGIRCMIVPVCVGVVISVPCVGVVKHFISKDFSFSSRQLVFSSFGVSSSGGCSFGFKKRFGILDGRVFKNSHKQVDPLFCFLDLFRFCFGLRFDNDCWRILKFNRSR